MSDQAQHDHASNHSHDQLIRYEFLLNERHWWGGRKTLTIIGTRSSKQGDEVLVWTEDGGFWSINYATVRRVRATALPHEH